MGGRGSASGFSRTREFKFDVSGLSGSDKQKAWAQRIVDDALNTINANIKLLTSPPRNRILDSAEEAKIYSDFGKQIEEQLKKFTKASEIIDYRDIISTRRIRQEVSNWLYMRKKR